MATLISSSWPLLAIFVTIVHSWAPLLSVGNTFSPPDRLPFDGQSSFSLRSRLRVVHYNGDTFTSELDESYSPEQRRARLDFKLITDVDDHQQTSIYASSRQPTLGTFYLHSPATTNESTTAATGEVALVVDRTSGECKLSSTREFNEQLLMLGADGPLQSQEPLAESFLVGPVRLLFLVYKNLLAMKLLESESEVKIRNVFALVYQFSLPDDSKRSDSTNKVVKVNVFYSQTMASVDPQRMLPIRITLDREGHSLTTVDYTRYYHQASLSRQTMFTGGAGVGDDGADGGGDRLLDEFAFPLVRCDDQLRAAAAGAVTSKERRLDLDLFASHSPENVRFSFRAHVGYTLPGAGMPSTTVRSFVAYDAGLDSMRVDARVLNDMGASTTGVRQQLFNFRFNRAYHVVEQKSNNGAGLLDQVLDLGKLESTTGAFSASGSSYTQCAIAKLLPLLPYTRKAFSIGRLLAGANRFFYMGNARVRGIESAVYEASEECSSVWKPFWLDPPIQYRTSIGAEVAGQVGRLRDPVRGAAAAKAGNCSAGELKIVLYFAQNKADHPLLLIELYSRVGPQSVQAVYERKSIQIHDFLWDLSDTPDGDQASELFSLQDHCSASAAAGAASARVELLLEPSLKSDQPRDSPQREFNKDLVALLASLQQNLAVPATMIYDLQWSQVRGRGRHSSGGAVSQTGTLTKRDEPILVSFSVAEHADNLVEPVYLGQGRVKYPKPEHVRQVVVRSFLACFFLAAHRRADIHFGYEPKQRICSLDLRPASGGNRSELATSFRLDDTLPVELYRAAHTTDQARPKRWIKNAQDEPRWLGAELSLATVAAGPNSARQVKFVVRSARRLLDRDSDSSPRGSQLPASSRPSGAGNTSATISGFGLVSLDVQHGNRLVQVPPLTNSTMSQDQCQAVCLADFECRAYSVCLDGQKGVECIVSSADGLGSPKVMKQLEQLKRSPATTTTMRRQRQVSVSLDDERTIALVQHPNCQIFNKVFLDLFGGPASVEKTVTNRRLRPVSGREECAQLCFQRNIEVLREDVKHAQHQSIVAHASHNNNNNLDRQLLHQTTVDHRQLMGQLCRTFMYLDKLQLEAQSAQERKRILDQVLADDRDDRKAGATTSGYCLVGERASEREKDELMEASKFQEPSWAPSHYLPIEQRQFKFELLYEQQYGVRLLASRMSPAEVVAQRAANFQPHEATQSTYVILRHFIERGENAQASLRHDRATCALICFRQSWGPWPACRSFDVITEWNAGGRQLALRCHLNSITMRQAIKSGRFDLIDDKVAARQMVWHFEPRSGYALDEATLEAELETAQAASEWVEESQATEAAASVGGGQSSSSVRTALIALLSSAFGILTGALLGVQLAWRLLDGRTLSLWPLSFSFLGQWNDDKQTLVQEQSSSSGHQRRPAAAMELSDRVNFGFEDAGGSNNNNANYVTQ